MTSLRSLAPLALVLVACGDDGNGSADAGPPDPCAPAMTFTGELLDWDGAMGVFSATMTLRSDPSETDVTAPNGRFDLECIPATDGLVDVLAMSGSGYVSGTVVVNRNVLAALPVLSYRTFTMTRAADFSFDVSLAHVYVNINGAARTVTTAATPGTMQALASATWSPGNTGNNIYLGNIPVSSTTTLMVSGGSVTGPTTIPLSAGQFTYVTLLATD